MTKRKLLIGLTVAGIFAGGFSAAVLPASAEMKSVTATLVSGRKVTMVIDVPPGTPPSQITLPGVGEPVVSVVVNSLPSSSPSTSTTEGASPTPAPKSAPQPTGPAAAGHPMLAGGGHGRAQRTTGHRKARLKRKAVKQKPHGHAKKPAKSPARTPGGAPTAANPSYSYALPGPTQPGVPDFFIDKFRVPIFLLPIYEAAGSEYSVPWQVLAAINEIETDYGRNMNVSSAGAVGWMQFLPSTWKQYGVDATQKGKKDPNNPADAIFAAARYLKAAGAQQDLRKAIFAYNHATWYVDSVMLRAKLIGGLPDSLLGSLTGLTQAHFPVAARARYADDAPAKAKAHGRGKRARQHDPLGTHIYAAAGSPVIAVQDGKVIGLGKSRRLGNFIRLRDAFGNAYTYAHLKSVVSTYPVPKPRKVSQSQVAHELKLPGANDPKPSQPATAGEQLPKPVPATRAAPSPPAPTADPAGAAPAGAAPAGATPAPPTIKKERVFANPARPGAYRAGGQQQLATQGETTTALPAGADLSSYFTEALGLRRTDMVLKPLQKGSTVIAGTILGRIGVSANGGSPHVLFQIRPGGRHTPLIDPKPILDGWKLLEATSIYRAAGKNPFLGTDAKIPSVGQVFLMSKEALQQRVLHDPNVSIYECGRRDIAAGAIDRRVLATIEALSVWRLKPTISALKCGHSFLTSSGNVSEHSSGNAVDIAKINGVSILNHQGPGSITDITIRRLLTMQGLYKAHQIISLMTYPGTDNTLSLPDHADHIHVGFSPLYSSDPKVQAQVDSALKPHQWIKLIDRLRQIRNPVVSPKPSSAAINTHGD